MGKGDRQCGEQRARVMEFVGAYIGAIELGDHGHGRKRISRVEEAFRADGLRHQDEAYPASTLVNTTK